MGLEFFKKLIHGKNGSKFIQKFKSNLNSIYFCSQRRVVDTMDLDVPFVQTCGFGGPDMKNMIITTSFKHVDIATGNVLREQSHNPKGGNLIIVENFGSGGFPQKKLCH